MDSPNSYPTTSDISQMMQELGYNWSNEAQVYLDWDFEQISRKSAERLYQYFLGKNPYSPLKTTP